MSTPKNNGSSSGGLNNRFSSYQQGGGGVGGGGGGGGSYQPPATFADQQTDTLTDTVKTQYQAEGTANAVLTRMTEQRHQLSGAHDNVSEMRTATEKARLELQQLHSKYREKKFRLYVTIAALGLTDLLLFFRIVQCRGGFFC